MIKPMNPKDCIMVMSSFSMGVVNILFMLVVKQGIRHPYALAFCFIGVPLTLTWMLTTYNNYLLRSSPAPKSILDRSSGTDSARDARTLAERVDGETGPGDITENIQPIADEVTESLSPMKRPGKISYLSWRLPVVVLTVLASTVCPLFVDLDYRQVQYLVLAICILATIVGFWFRLVKVDPRLSAGVSALIIALGHPISPADSIPQLVGIKALSVAGPAYILYRYFTPPASQDDGIDQVSQEAVSSGS